MTCQPCILEAQPAREGRGITFFVVGEPPVSELCARVAADLRLNVIQACTGESAAAVLAEHSIDILVLDLSLPKLSELSKTAIETQPTASIIFLTRWYPGFRTQTPDPQTPERHVDPITIHQL